MVGAAAYNSKRAWQGKAGLEAWDVDRVDVTQAKSQRDEEKQWFPGVLLPLGFGRNLATFSHLLAIGKRLLLQMHYYLSTSPPFTEHLLPH